MKIVVLSGGPGSEREVSLRSGLAVAKALREGGNDVREVIVDDHSFSMGDAEIAFNAIHGTYGEDGGIQTELERRGLFYSGDSPEANRLAFDKVLSKKAFQDAGITTPASETIFRGEKPSLQLPLVIKAPRQGSSVGVYICKSEIDLSAALSAVIEFGDDILVEEFITGDELTVGILGELALPVIMIRPKDGIYDFKNKYPWLNPDGAAEHFCPAPLSDDMTKKIQNLALDAHRSLGLKIYSRVDILLTRDGKPFVLEVNTVPGMTESSLLPEAALVAGIDMSQLCQKIIDLSITRLKEEPS